MLHDISRWASALLILGLSGCGSYTGTDTAVADATGSVPTGPTKNCGDLFARIQPRLDFCRTCHVDGGVAFVEEGKKFLLTSDRSQDLANLTAAWIALGKNDNGPSRILTMASDTDTTRKHSGGPAWPVDSLAYSDMSNLLQGFVDPAACVSGSGTDAPELPLLGSKHARHVWDSYCSDDGTGQPRADDAALLQVQDPRTMIVKGNTLLAGKAVFFNAWWEDCHKLEYHDDEKDPWPTTCGGFRERRDKGLRFLHDTLPTGSDTADTFRGSWSKWNVGTPVDEKTFERMYTLRYGWNPAPADSDTLIPLANSTSAQTYVSAGVTGTLPLGMRLNHGTVGQGACYTCHGGRIGDPFDDDEKNVMSAVNIGMGNNNYDGLMVGKDGTGLPQVPVVSDSITLPPLDPTVVLNLGIKQRGQNNAVGAFELLVTLLDYDNLGLNPNVAKASTPGLLDPSDLHDPTGVGDGTASPTGGSALDQSHPLAHTQDTPAWWNMGSRPRKFFDAGVSNDSTRIIMAAGDLNGVFSQNGETYRTSIEQHDQDLATYFLSLRSPEWPEKVLGALDVKKAEAGAVLFHTKNLFAAAGNADRPKPVDANGNLLGNGSCASCHGAYSPRFVNDKRYLATPELEGVAGNIVDLAVINTDHARSDMLTPSLRRGWDSTYWAYPEGQPNYTKLEDKDPLTEFMDDMESDSSPVPNARTVIGACRWEKDVIGYQAPPLYGVWATAPYFHNGSVPTLKLVLGKSADRPVIWQRQLERLGANGVDYTKEQVDADTSIKYVTGFDQRLKHAYNVKEVGWKYTALACKDMPGTEQMNCNPVDDQGPSLTQLFQNYLNGLVAYSGAANIPDPAPGSFDKRLVFDTRTLGNGKGGHDFSDVLTDTERDAIIEYLKTL